VTRYHAGVSRIQIITPHTDAAGSGNATTAQRWALRLRELHHQVHVATRYDGWPCDILLALHASKSAASIRRFRSAFPRHPTIVALTGTDLYRDLRRSARAQESVQGASRLVVLQKLALRELAPRHRRKAVVIEQSVRAPSDRERAFRKRAVARASRTVETSAVTIVVLANLRHVKDPLRAAFAARRLRRTSRIQIIHAGNALTAAYERRARRESRLNGRYTWVGPVRGARARRLLLGSHALVLSSRLEGGANVVSEAIVLGVPVLASRIPGSVGLLGHRYPGYFDVGDTRGLSALLQRFEDEPEFVESLRRHIRSLATRLSPARERTAWRSLLRGMRE